MRESRNTRDDRSRVKIGARFQAANRQTEAYMADMFHSLSTHEQLYAALLARDPAYDGHVYACVETTGVFCRMTCPARKPKSENTCFYDTAAACFEHGFRPCQRCRPLDR